MHIISQEKYNVCPLFIHEYLLLLLNSLDSIKLALSLWKLDIQEKKEKNEWFNWSSPQQNKGN